MKLQSLMKELKEKDFFSDFMSKNADAFLSAGFFIFDLDAGIVKGQLDFFIPSKKKIATAEYPFKEIKIHDDEIRDAKKLTEEVKVDVSDIEDEVKRLQKENNNSLKISKIIAILQNDFWSLTCLSDMLDLLKIKINSLTGKCDNFEKGNLMNFMNVKKK